MKKLVFMAVLAAVAAFALLPAGAQAKTVPGPIHASLPGPGPGGDACEVDQFTFYGVDNNIHPGEIGLVSVLGCNAAATLVAHQWLLEYDGNGGWMSMNETYAQHSYSNRLAISTTTWYKCDVIASTASNYIQAKASWDMNFNTPAGYNTYGDYSTNHWTKCWFPTVVSLN